MYPGHVIPYRATYGRKPHGGTHLQNFTHYRRAKQAHYGAIERPPLYIFLFFTCQRGGCLGWMDHSEALKAISDREVSLNFFFAGV